MMNAKPNPSCRIWKLPEQIMIQRVNEYDIAYIELGKGDPLIFVHGSLSDYRSWSLQMDVFSRYFRTISLSLRHCYPEPWDGKEGDFSIRRHASDLTEFIKKLKLGPVHLAGHSRGGALALFFAAANPLLVRSLILADPAPFDSMLPVDPAAVKESEHRTSFVNTTIDYLEQGDIDAGLALFTDSVGTKGTWDALPETIRQIRRDNAWSIKSLVTDAKESFTASDAQKITSPVLLLTGEKSPCLYGIMHSALEQCLLDYTKKTISNASHGMHSENPVEFNAFVLDFLKSFH